MFRDVPGARLEPGPRSVADSVAKVEAILEAVPGLRLTLDTGHVATWGEDPVLLLRHADHVQLRQAAPGKPQLHPDDADGVVDFRGVLAELERLDYPGLMSVEYFDLPDMRMPLDDPVGHAVALAAYVRALPA
jgi:sugar phosphate isomerase/epimerase